MDWGVILSYVLKGLGSAAATLIITLGSILFAKLKTKIGEARLNSYIDKCVKAAEQLFPNLGKKTGAEKYQYVLELVQSKFPKYTELYLKPLIEGAVFTISEQIKQIQRKKETEDKGSNADTNNSSSLSSF